MRSTFLILLSLTSTIDIVSSFVSLSPRHLPAKTVPSAINFRTTINNVSNTRKGSSSSSPSFLSSSSSSIAMDSFTRINHVGIRVNDMATSREFYEKLGFVWIVGPVGPEPVAIMEHQPSGIMLNLILNGNDETPHNVLMDEPPSTKHSGITHLALEVPDIDKVQTALETDGITVTERMTLPGNGISIFIRDPDKTTIEFHQPGTKWWEDKTMKDKMEKKTAEKK